MAISQDLRQTPATTGERASLLEVYHRLQQISKTSVDSVSTSVALCGGIGSRQVAMAFSSPQRIFVGVCSE